MILTAPGLVLYGENVSGIEGGAAPTAGQRFAQAIRTARAQKGWTQDDLVEESGVSAPTIKRWEGGNSERPEPELVRRVFRALGLDPREAAVILGYVTREEMGLPQEPPRRFSVTVEQVIAILEDPEVPDREKEEWVRYLQFRTGRLGSEAEQARPARRRAAG